MTKATKNRAQVRSPEAAAKFASALQNMCDGLPLRVEFWDGTRAGSPNDDAVTVSFRSPRALDRMLGGHPERTFGRAFSEGLIDIEPLETFLSQFAKVPARRVLAAVPALLRALVGLGGRPDLRRVDGAEAKLRGRRHTRARDAAAIRHHYDLPEEFYALWLDQTLTYSCAYFESPDDDINKAQQAKLDLVCRKLRLQPGERVLDVGCGWGSFPIHAAKHYGVEVLGITLSPRQADVAIRRAREADVADKVTIKLADYRDSLPGRFDAVASIGMVEHVGRKRMKDFGSALYGALKPGGRLLLHGITIPEDQRWNRTSFLDAFVFPDGELEGVSWRDGQMQRCGFELRDVESLREHYVLTLQSWATALKAHWDQAVAIAGPERARVWLLYQTASAVSFRLGMTSIYQSLFVRPTVARESGLPLRRSDLYRAEAEVSGNQTRQTVRIGEYSP